MGMHISIFVYCNINMSLAPRWNHSTSFCHLLSLLSLWPHAAGQLWQCGDVQVRPPAGQHRGGGGGEETTTQHGWAPQGLWAGNWDPQIPPAWKHRQIQRCLLQCRYEHITWYLYVLHEVAKKITVLYPVLSFHCPIIWLLTLLTTPAHFVVHNNIITSWWSPHSLPRASMILSMKQINLDFLRNASSSTAAYSTAETTYWILSVK